VGKYLLFPWTPFPSPWNEHFVKWNSHHLLIIGQNVMQLDFGKERVPQELRTGTKIDI